MPQAEHILEKVALNEVSALPWRWTLRDEDEWTAEFQILDDDGMEHEVDVEFAKAKRFFPPGYELTPIVVRMLKSEWQIPHKLLTRRPKKRIGPKGMSMYAIDFYTDRVFDKDDLGSHLSFAKIAPRLFATVADVVRTFVKERKPDVLAWHASSGSRASVFKRIVKREKLPGYVGWHGTRQGGYLRLGSPLAR